MENRPKTAWMLFHRDFRVHLISSFFKDSMPCKKTWVIVKFHRNLLNFSYRFVIPNRGDLSAKHDGCEESKEETLEDEKEQEDDGGGRREGRAGVPLGPQAMNKVADGQEKRVERHCSDVKLKRN